MPSEMAANHSETSNDNINMKNENQEPGKPRK